MKFVVAGLILATVLLHCGAQMNLDDHMRDIREAYCNICKLHGMTESRFNDTIVKRMSNIIKVYKSSKLANLKTVGLHNLQYIREFCEETKPVLVLYVSELQKEMTACFAKEKAYLMPFIKVSFDGLMNYICEENGKNLKDIFSTPEQKQCVQKLQFKDFGKCSRNYLDDFQEVRFDNRDELCNILGGIKACIHNDLSKDCKGPHLKSHQHHVNKLFNIFPCSSAWSAISNTSLLATTSSTSTS